MSECDDSIEAKRDRMVGDFFHDTGRSIASASASFTELGVGDESAPVFVYFSVPATGDEGGRARKVKEKKK